MNRLRRSRFFSLAWLLRLGLVVLGVCLIVPQAWAWYQLRSAKNALARYHPEEAKESLRSCLGVWESSPSVHLLMSRSARQTGDFDLAISELHTAQRLLGGATSETAFEWALLQAAAGNVREFEEYLQKQANQSPEAGPLVWEALVEGYLRSYRNGDAMVCLSTWLKRSPDDIRALELRGRTYVAGKGVVNGTRDYRRVLELDPTRKPTRWRLIEGLINLGTYDEAAAHLEIFAREEPDNPAVAARLARCYIVLNQRAQARQLLDRILEKYPDDGPCLRVRGQFALTESTETEAAADAEVWLRRAAAALPEDYQTQYLFFETLRRQGKTEEANEQHRIAEAVKDRLERLSELRSRKLTEQPLDPALHYEMGMLLLRGRYPESGVRWLETALGLDPGHTPSHAALADYYEKTGNKTQADEHRKAAANAK